MIKLFRNSRKIGRIIDTVLSPRPSECVLELSQGALQSCQPLPSFILHAVAVAV